MYYVVATAAAPTGTMSCGEKSSLSKRAGKLVVIILLCSSVMARMGVG